MPTDISPGSLAAVTIAVLFWWTALSHAALLAGVAGGVTGSVALVLARLFT